jgi:hypothetical protein
MGMGPTGSRSFSTSSKTNLDSNEFDSDPEIENMTSSQIVELLPDTKFRNKYLALQKNKNLKEFKKLYKGGYLGYTNIQQFSNVSELINSEISDIERFEYFSILVSELDKYLYEIPENVIYSVLPVLR